jgi:penicillin-binding protein 2
MSLNKQFSKQSQKKLTRRGLILFGAQVAVMGTLALRLRYLQVDQAEEFRLLAEENRINIRLLPPARGLIFDRKGVPIAENNQNYRIIMVREQAGDVAEILDRLGKIIPLNSDDYAAAVKELKRRADFVPITIAEHLTWEQLSSVSANSPALPGVTAEVGLQRNYPMVEDFAHIVGYVGAVNKRDLENAEDQDPLLQIPSFKIGKTGIEEKIERPLRGTAGTKRIEVNAVGRVMREIDRVDSTPGQDVVLTVDQGLQNYVQARLVGQSAAAVVIDVRNGDIMALGSAPSFDPNKFINGISSKDYNLLRDDKYRPFANKATQGTFPPGSTFKMIVALAALEDGLIDTKEKINCRGFIEVGNQRFHCWKRSGHGLIDMKNSLKQSCDVYYYELAQRVGIEKISAMARRFGLGSKFELPLNAVNDGRIPTKSWKQARFKEPWRIGDTINASIGQGFVATSPLQLAVMTARLATGRAVVPRLIKSIGGVEQKVASQEGLGISSSSFAAVRGGMFAVSNERGGTGFASRIEDDSLQMAGKSGTSQVRRITRKERKTGVISEADLAWERRDHALYVAYAPFDAPRYAVAVVVEHGGGGSRFAAPIVRDIMLEALYDGQPPLTAYPKSQRTRIGNERKELILRGPQT